MTDQRGEQRLDGWKSIARHLGRDERTVKRWEARGLPVRRVPGGTRAPVYTTVRELDRWLNAQAPGQLDRDDVGDTPPANPADVNGVPTAIEPGSGNAGPPDRALLRQGPAPQVAGRAAALPRRPLRVALAVAAGLTGAAIAFAPLRHATPARAVAGPAIPADAPFGASSPLDAQARERYLDGLHAWNLRTPASLALARDDFGAAIAREPGYAPAYAGLANTYLLLREFGAMSDAEAYAKALAAADSALRLDPTLAAAHRARAFALYWGRRESTAAWAEFARAGALAPGEALTWHWYATALDGAGRSSEALRMIERARALDPASTAILADKGVIVYRAGDRDQGRALELRVLALDPRNIDAHRDLARMAMTEGRASDARLEWDRVASLGGSVEERSPLRTGLPSARVGARPN